MTLVKKACYRVVLPTTNALHRTYKRKDGHYLDVEDSCLYVIASDAGAVGVEFPDALAVQRVGIGYAGEDDHPRPDSDGAL